MQARSLLTLYMMGMVSPNIQIINSSPSSPTLVEEGSLLSMSCSSDISWFLCVWLSPTGDRVCAIQEGERTNQVCKGDPRVQVQGDASMCRIAVSNATREDWGVWICHLQDGEEFKADRKEIDVQIARKAALDIEIRDGVENAERDTDLILTEGDVVEITCSAKGGYPKPYFHWEGPTYSTRRVRKFVGDVEKDVDYTPRRNEDVHCFNSSTNLFNSRSTIVYTASTNHTNSSITCKTMQGMMENQMYGQAKYIRLVVNPLPPPLAKVDKFEKMGVIAGAILSILLILLILILSVIFICRRKKRTQSESCESSEYQVKPVWRTESSGFENWQVNSHPRNEKVGSTSVSESDSALESSGSDSVIRPETRSTKTLSDSDSYQTERELVEVEHKGASPRLAPSIHETHFSSNSSIHPLTTLHPAGLPIHLPGRFSLAHGFGGSVSYLEPYTKKPSSTVSDGALCYTDPFSLGSRPVSALDVYLNPAHLPQRVSTPTCPGSKSSISLFQCPHDCFVETDVTEDTIEEIDEEDLDSLNKLVRQGLNVGTDNSSCSSQDKDDKPKRTTAVTSL